MKTDEGAAELKPLLTATAPAQVCAEHLLMPWDFRKRQYMSHKDHLQHDATKKMNQIQIKKHIQLTAKYS